MTSPTNAAADMTPTHRLAQLIRAAAPDAAADDLAVSILALLMGTDDGEPCGVGLLDRYELRTIDLDAGPTRIWYCDRDHRWSGHPKAGIICRDIDGRQDGVTLGEFVRTVLQHEAEEHTGLEGGDDA